MQKQKIPKLIILTSVFITLVATPWVNFDSLIVPKMAVLFCLGLFILPTTINSTISLYKSRNYQDLIYLLICIGIITQLLIVMLLSNAPLVQQIFGRGGRGLGFLTQLSLIVVFMAIIATINFSHIRLLNISLVIASQLSSTYSIMQYFNLDIFSWTSRTNGIIGTLGNPNFQSAFTAMALVPTCVYLTAANHKKKITTILLIGISLYTIYICQSTQGYVGVVLSISIFISFYLWYKNRVLFKVYAIGFFSLVLIAISGMANYGPLKNYLYKYSVKSRNEFWRTAISTSSDNPIVGVGIDSFGDFSSMYKSEIDSRGVNEFTDNAHNYILEYAATGGIPLALLHICVIFTTFIAFLLIQKQVATFNKYLAALFSAWICFQAQSLISPGSIPLMLWNMIISGFFIGVSLNIKSLDLDKGNIVKQIKVKNFNTISVVLVMIGIFIIYPYFNADKMFLKSINTGDALLAVKSATIYPESVNRYTKVGVMLLESKLPDQALEVGRSAVNFNPNSAYSWLIILANDKASYLERTKAKAEILRLDPYNKEIQSVVVLPN